MRRALLAGGAATLATLLLPARASAAQARRLTLRHSGSGARFSGIWHDGSGPDRVAMAELSQVLADPGCDAIRAFDPETVEIVWQVAERTRLGNEIEVHSGYRTPQVNRAVRGAGDSLHLRASAMDVGIPAGRLPAVAEAALKLARGGVGIYRRRSFVHLDSGGVRHWSDGGAARHAASARERQLDGIAAAWQRSQR